TSCSFVRNLDATPGGAVAIGGMFAFNRVGTNPGVLNQATPIQDLVCMESSGALEHWKCTCCYDGKKSTLNLTVPSVTGKIFSVSVRGNSGGHFLRAVGAELPLPYVGGWIGTNIGLYGLVSGDWEKAHNVCRSSVGKGRTI